MTRYATTADLARLGISSAALQGVATATQEAALDACSAVADGYLRARGYVLPLTT
jgi:phage gp36-like protein